MTITRRHALTIFVLVATAAVLSLLLRPTLYTEAAVDASLDPTLHPEFVSGVAINGVVVGEITPQGAVRSLAWRDPATLRPENVRRVTSRSGVTVLELSDGSELELGPWERSRLNPTILRSRAYVPAR